MPQLFTITDDWNEHQWYNTGGTRAKKYLQSPEGKYYYFKRSQYKEPTDSKPGKDFKYEFWSEVIAYEIGTVLGFNVLRYDIAIYNELMGCICESMINSEEEELIEGVQYLRAFSPNYDPENKEHRKRYTFQLIENSLEKAKLKDEVNNIIEIIVFDALIGNGDRHQENWAIINKQTLMHDAIEEMEKTGEISNVKNWQRKFLIWLKENLKSIHKDRKEKGQRLPKAFYLIETRFAPIYDSGSSLGRELVNEKAELYLNSSDELNKYIDRGLAEVHWNGDKINHFDLINNLLEHPLYTETVKKTITRIVEKWDGSKIEQIVQQIDGLVPESHINYKIPENRKQLIFKIITLRFQRLRALLHERI